MKCLQILAAVAACVAGSGQVHAAEFSGRLRLDAIDVSAANKGPLAQANAKLPGLVAPPADSSTLQAELRGSAGPVSGVVTLRQQYVDGQGSDSKGTVNELYASGTLTGAWQYTVGRRIVSWDVGEAFRPNDVVQQEPRRLLVPVLPTGRLVATAEYFGANDAWSMVLVNADKERSKRGAEEPAVALRYYLRDGALDWHGIARYGAHTHGSLGGALAWVATDALELHASVRYQTAADTLAFNLSGPSPLAQANPWQAGSTRNVAQALIGGTWTTASRFSLLAEAWWDGAALSDSQWDAWGVRNRQLGAISNPQVPVSALAGNLAWQATAFSTGLNLRRLNLFTRASWKLGEWEPAVDLLYTPEDAGRVVTASLAWQGDSLRIDGGIRINGGPHDALLAQVPTRRSVFIYGTWNF